MTFGLFSLLFCIKLHISGHLFIQQHPDEHTHQFDGHCGGSAGEMAGQPYQPSGRDQGILGNLDLLLVSYLGPHGLARLLDGYVLVSGTL